MEGSLDIGPLVLWAAALMTLLGFGTSVWNIMSSGAKRNTQKLAEHDARLAANDIEVQRLRDRVEGLPDGNTMHRLELSMARMEGHIDRLDERLKPVAAIAARMQDLLIEQGKTK